MTKKTIALTAIVIAILALLIAGCLEEGPSTEIRQMPTPETTPTPSPIPTPALKVDSFDLLWEFDENSIAAEAKYKGQVIEVSGTVLDIGRRILGEPYVKLEGIDEYGFSCVMCTFPSGSESQLIPLRKYDWVTIRGSYNGYHMERVSLVKCELISVEEE